MSPENRLVQIHPFVTELAASWPSEDWQDLSVILAVSGGPDSVALLRAMVTIKNETAADQAGPVVAQGPLIVGHFHHGLRPQQADADQAFVESLCQDLGVPCETGSADVRKIAAQQGDGLEAAGVAVAGLGRGFVAAKTGRNGAVPRFSKGGQLMAK